MRLFARYNKEEIFQVEKAEILEVKRSIVTASAKWRQVKGSRRLKIVDEHWLFVPSLVL